MIRRLMKALGPRSRSFRPARGRGGAVQSGAIPYAWVDGEPVYLLITSRRTGRWIFPKGRIADDLTPWESAAKEAMEEAGVTGAADPAAVGSYRTRKVEGNAGRWINVELYPLRVEDQLESWPEQHSRRRGWASLRQARRMIDNRGLFRVLAILDARLREGA